MSDTVDGVEIPLTDMAIDLMMNSLSDEDCRSLLRGVLRERRGDDMVVDGRAPLEFLLSEWRKRLEIVAAVGTPVAEGLPGPGERVQIILDAVRGPLGDRWIVEEPWPRLIADEMVAAWRPSWAGDWAALVQQIRLEAAREGG